MAVRIPVFAATVAFLLCSLTVLSQAQSLMRKVTKCPADLPPDRVHLIRDPDDCHCFFFCTTHNSEAKKMCCAHRDLWFDEQSSACTYRWDFSPMEQQICSLQFGPGTDTNIKDMFIGMCLYYQHKMFPGLFSSPVDCESLFKKFMRVFSKKSSCGEVQVDDYVEMLEECSTDVPEGREVLITWNAPELAHKLAKVTDKMFMVEDTLLGYTLNDINWCGQEKKPYVNFERCPLQFLCEDHPMDSFFAAATKVFAKRAQGVVHVLVNGSLINEPSFANETFFAKYQIPNLDSNEVPLIKIWVAHDLDRPYSESCGNGTIKELERQLSARGLNYECEDNPYALTYLLCIETPDVPICRNIYMVAQPATSEPAVIAKSAQKLKAEHEVYGVDNDNSANEI